MTFNEGGQFEGGRVRKGGRRGAVGAGVGGGATIIIALLYMVLTGNSPADLLGGTTDGGGGEQGYVGDCTAEQANTDPECRLNGAVQSLDAYWAATLPEQGGVEYQLPEVVSFTQAVSTGCGNATSATGPFYCPADTTVYEDLSFYDQLSSQFGAEGGPLAEMYVTAHEFGHHIENQLGLFERADRSGTGPESDSVRIELMADCLAGMWAGNAATTEDPDTGVTFLEPISQDELEQALSAAAAVGDDNIQRRSGGDVNPEAFSHGSSEQRVRWFTIGYEGGTIQDCNALDASRL
ncbi:neutral zinc metallopeptidase [Promicromonospora citrea]|uniref:Membrane protein n=1 Tax=Promicromonospora citrea TaxID=43677 RepID=A0A8H9GKC0_9MICO|nr:neutral zinc metallopeptidase [Promicromonospora citrea]NNH52063.1 neutral zinc metallopeptidase [Promicromonospora citrea]GGM34446.1 membrane protein [Promicromonospora citrea]